MISLPDQQTVTMIFFWRSFSLVLHLGSATVWNAVGYRIEFIFRGMSQYDEEIDHFCCTKEAQSRLHNGEVLDLRSVPAIFIFLVFSLSNSVHMSNSFSSCAATSRVVLSGFASIGRCQLKKNIRDPPHLQGSHLHYRTFRTNIELYVYWRSRGQMLAWYYEQFLLLYVPFWTHRIKSLGFAFLHFGFDSRK